MAPSSNVSTADPFSDFKAKQRQTWALGNFADIAAFTTYAAGHLARFAEIPPGQRVLDVACGTGVLAITLALRGARATGIDLTPELLAQARASAELGQVAIDWREGDVEALPFPDGSFDAVVSQFGHLFAPRPDVAVREMLRVLRPGGRLAFATWPPEGLVGKSFGLGAKYIPPPPGVAPIGAWGDPAIVKSRLGAAVRDLEFERGVLPWPALSVRHYRSMQETKAGPFIRAQQVLSPHPARLQAYNKEYDDLVGSFMADNIVRHEYLLARAQKA